ncbi:MotA/TolQ/ExbB proton channel family protein [Sandaracinus amylolyticus]|uniref:MotA/TolQ/ExbB proton channel family protein n=1 Tax=Sandaracinus amylolyticus TaxID=927083 RepID=A0A0F6W2C8_9BACT|nr:MotA/TolQ/ExbB proton channel family protein [Sandaracinus amylolyticus]AKF05661.1 MotA/TolQ/ExbB proton channel family protein [Sandaracinus amylolyticus]UJR81733.1 Flagellar motor protein MotA [Sandaracinus amylolyticus]
MDIQERLTAFAMLGATWVMWLLVLLSIVGLAIILERAYYLFVSRDDIAKLKSDLLAKLRSNDVDAARTRMRQSRSVEAQVALAGLDAAEDGAETAEERMDGQTSISRLNMERNLAFLGTVGNNAPFVGLAGTVIGIIRAFHELNESQGQVSAGLMAEVGEALVATLIGLLVALPAVAFFNLFQRIIKARLTRADAMGREVLAFLKSERRKNGVAEAAAE